MARVSLLTLLAEAVAGGDLIPMVNISDTAQSASGSTRKMTASQLYTYIFATLAGAITANELAANAVVTAKILDANVTANKLASDSVTTPKVLDANITFAKLENLAANRILGSVAGGVPSPLTAAQVKTIIAMVSTDISDFVEAVQDALGAIVSSPLVYNDGANTLAFDQTANLGNNARTGVLKNGTLIGTRRGINLIEGSNAILTIADNAGAERIDVTIAATGGGGGASLQLSVYNNSGSTIAKGVPVRISGYNVGSSFVEVTPADADAIGTMPCIGVTDASIANAASGTILLGGKISGLDTSGRTVNDPLYVSGTPGVATATAPTTGYVQEVARVSRVDGSLGEIIVNPGVVGQPVSDGSSLFDVNNNEVLGYGVVASAVNNLEAKNAITGNKAKLRAVGGDTNIGIHLERKGTGVVTGAQQVIPIACSDETTALTAGVGKITFRMPFAFTLTDVRASVGTAPTGAALLTVDVNENGTTILSTKLTFDASEKTTVTAATPRVISDANLADDAEITIDIDQIGSTVAGAGLKVYLIGFIPE